MFSLSLSLCSLSHSLSLYISLFLTAVSWCGM
jgi:hypothetical protein